jgi:Tfp pilus assembly major pilin PilA
MSVIDRKAVSTALAKAIAYKQCDKQKEAEEWAKKVVELLECANILKS